MSNEKIFQKTLHFPGKKLVRNIFWDTQEDLEFQTLSKLYFMDNIVTDNKKNSI